MLIKRPPSIIDIEASGFGAASYPIEVGVALGDGRTYCSLIAPRLSWTHWDESAEKVHRVTRDILHLHGKPVPEVAGQLNELLRSQTVYSDGWVVDKPWLDRLFFAAGMPCEFSCSALEMILSDSQMAIWHATKDALGAGRPAASRELRRLRHSGDLASDLERHGCAKGRSPVMARERVPFSVTNRQSRNLEWHPSGLPPLPTS